jgi:hypothetical protein
MASLQGLRGCCLGLRASPKFSLTRIREIREIATANQVDDPLVAFSDVIPNGSADD